jgi:opacity protein-like surface antigen
MYRYAVLSIAMASSVALADSTERSQIYTELDALYFSSPGDFDDEQTMGITLGYSLDSRHSIEAELQVNGLDSQEFGFEADADLFTYLLGYRYNFSREGDFKYFAGVGVGYSRAEFYTDTSTKAEQDLTIGFARVGLDYDFSENAYISGELRYQQIPDLDRNNVKYDIGGVPVVGISVGYRF